MIFTSDLSSKPSTIALALAMRLCMHLLIDGVAVRFNEDGIVHRRTDFDASLNAEDASEPKQHRKDDGGFVEACHFIVKL